MTVYDVAEIAVRLYQWEDVYDDDLVAMLQDLVPKLDRGFYKESAESLVQDLEQVTAGSKKQENI